MKSKNFVKRLWEKDASLWKEDKALHKEIRERLGWLDLPQESEKILAPISDFAESIKKEGFKKILLLGMGGSSLAPEVFQKVIGNKKGHPELVVLDSTDPDRIREVEKSLDLKKTLFIVSSKSGGTIEMLSCFKYFYKKVPDGRQFVAITDPGSGLEAQAKKLNFRKIFLGNPDVGGRFSALSVFGLLPAALIGVDVAKILKRARQAALACKKEGKSNKALALGTAMGLAAQNKMDKLVLIGSKKFAPLGDWIEQLVAESTGKEGKGIIPVMEYGSGSKGFPGKDRFVMNTSLTDPYDLGAKFFLWEMATAVACAVLQVNAFDQPDVQLAKEATKACLSSRQVCLSDKQASDLELTEFFQSLDKNSYIAILAFLPSPDWVQKKLNDLKKRLSAKTKKAVTIGIGPRYLHSTGQLHKGGTDSGRFILITAKHREDLNIPNAAYSFAQLESAQGEGDLQALRAKGRRVISCQLDEISERSLSALIDRLTT